MDKSSKKSISKSEYSLIEKVNEYGMPSFSADEAAKMMVWERSKAYKVVSSLNRKGLAESVGGRYVLMDGKEDLFSVASNLVWPSYLSFWTALSYYKFTEQLPRTLFVATTRQKKDGVFGGSKVKYVKIAKDRFFGYRKDGEVVVAEKEKALVDSLLLPRYAGGIAEVSKCLKNAWEELDKEMLVEYALRIENKTVLKRLGFLIEKNGLGIEDALVESLLKGIGKGYSKLDPQLKREGEYDDRWMVVVNVKC